MRYDCGDCTKGPFRNITSFISHLNWIHKIDLSTKTYDKRCMRDREWPTTRPYHCFSCEEGFIDIRRVMIHLQRKHNLTTWYVKKGKMYIFGINKRR